MKFFFPPIPGNWGEGVEVGSEARRLVLGARGESTMTPFGMVKVF